MKGGCLCGAVRYALDSAPYDAGWCHCRTCQLNSGSPAMAFATIPVDDFRWDAGEHMVGTYASSDVGHRVFCTRCGTPLYQKVTFQPATLDFSIATLDEPDRVAPGFHIFYDSRIRWAPACDDLPRHAQLRPNTDGLPPGQTTLDG